MISLAIRLAMPAEELGLSRCEAELLGLLLSEDRWWSRDELYREMSTQAAPCVIKVFANRINRKLRAANCNHRIEGRVRVGGFRISEEARQRLLHWPANQSEAA